MFDKTFIDKVLAGEAQPAEIDDYVDAWHEGEADERTLGEFLGMSPDEYARWATNPAALDAIIADHRAPVLSRHR